MNQHTSPIDVNGINEIEGIIGHFQTDRSFTKNYASSEQADILGDLSTVCLNFAANVSEVSGFGAVNRIIAYGSTSKFALFGLNPPKANPPGPRIFGVLMEPSAKIDEIVSQINSRA